MTGPGPPDGWGTGIPGIPSIWDTAPPAAAQPLPWAPPATPPGGRHGGSRHARLWAVGALGLTVLLLAGGVLDGTGGVLDGTDAEQAVGPGPVDVPLPGEEGWPPPPQPPAGPLGLPAPQPVLDPASLSASPADGGGEPFGLPIGTAVLLRGDGTRTVVVVTPLSLRRDDDDLVVDVELRAVEGEGVAAVPPLRLRLPDGQDVDPTAAGVDDRSTAQPFLLLSGQSWRGLLVFPHPAADATLVLAGERALAGWRVPAAG